MPQAFDIAKGLAIGELKQVTLNAGDVKGPEVGKRWIVLNGMLHHITENASSLCLYKGCPPKVGNMVATVSRQSAWGTGDCPLWCMDNYNANEQRGDSFSWCLDGDTGDCLKFFGGTGAYVNLLILEWKE
jgi:hypothetical protein